MAFGYLGRFLQLIGSGSGRITTTIEEFTTTASGYQTIKTFTTTTNSGLNIYLNISALNRTTFGEASTIQAQGGYRRAGGAPVLIGGGSGLNITQRDDFAPKVQVRLRVSGNDVILEANPNTADTVKFTYKLEEVNNG